MGKDDNGNRQIKTKNDIKVKNGFDLCMKCLEAIHYVQIIAKNRFPLNCSLETENFNKVPQSEN